MLKNTSNLPIPTPPTPAERLDCELHGALGSTVMPLSPVSPWLAWTDWAMHLALSPAQRVELLRFALAQSSRLARYVTERVQAGACDTCVEPPETDRRFADPAWRNWPFDLLQQSFLLNEEWWAKATHGLHGISPHHEAQVSFATRQWLDMFSPGNFLATNPVVLQRTAERGGTNLLQGARNAFEDTLRAMGLAAPAPTGYTPGENVAITPGKVVLRNRLIELIQYAPTTPTVRAEPILIVPAWIMKYYILDLSPSNSLIKYLVDQGHTVFCISWKNPGREDADLDLDDYVNLGFRAALDAVSAIVPDQRVHATGYCLGGTLLTIMAAAMARDGDERLASLTLFAAQVDFTEPGELALFIDDAQVAWLEDQMAQTGFLTTRQMAGAFQMLKSYDLVWSRVVGEYLMGERDEPNDLMAWNADATRMPARMHSHYLRSLYLDNDLCAGRFQVDGRPVALSRIRQPVFCVGTVTDHVAPWRSVYKLHHELVTDTTFVLTTGGHNAGIVSEPGRKGRSFHILERSADSAYLAPDDWLARAPQQQGSWWPAWRDWLDARSGAMVKPPRMGAAARGYPVLADAPGGYVLER